ncbi:zinc ABC transporter substrate-binding protein [Amorphus orientalis]|uniref:High-affinity zinc uptake system protein ZnuA n=1 Tax=Amorphus orientalis TaxID=649198 RepID=A0AAE3VSH2_9HYPH|nr:zinc ABC transporter substrate-binding protein [Amorphus orientalis]MDQ0317311.1 zinc transport system substrate-binding protein [Amorphus orientalis]
MKRISLHFAGAVLLAPGLAYADPPKVTTDVPPVHSLVAQVMQGVGEPSLILPPGASPHGYAMRPSEAARLSDADMVFWVGPELTPWLERSIDSLAADATSVALIDAPGTRTLSFREGATFEPHDHDHGDHGHDEEHGHEAHDHEHGEDHAQEADHGHGDEHSHGDQHGNEHGDEHAEAHGHDHEGFDPHAWLSPDNARVWLDVIAEKLAEADPENAATYRENAEKGKHGLDTLTAQIDGRLAPVRGEPFVVFHDAYHYFEESFDIEATAAVSLSDASTPGPARVEEVRDRIRDVDAVCVFTEPQFPSSLVDTVVEGTAARTGTLDPIGVDLEPGPALYGALLNGLADNMVACLKAD